MSSICVTTNFLDPKSIYPVFDPRRCAGPGPYSVLYDFAQDLVGVTVELFAGPSCSMQVNFKSTLSEPKMIQAWNIFNNDWVNRIGSPQGLPSSMKFSKANCELGADTVILARHFAWPREWQAMYTFPPQDFWDFWGGCNVTFEWFSDIEGSGLWGNQFAPIRYPLALFPDGTLLFDASGTLSVVFGGTNFIVNDPSYLAAMGFDSSQAVPEGGTLRAFPADGTLLREWNSSPRFAPFPPDVFVIYGGAKFRIPLERVGGTTLASLGFNFSQVRVIPRGGMMKLGTMPIDGTLLREQSDAHVFLVASQKLKWVTSEMVLDRLCLPWRNVRIVPDQSLAALPRGADIF